jgi:hypothetical protein
MALSDAASLTGAARTADLGSGGAGAVVVVAVTAEAFEVAAPFSRGWREVGARGSGWVISGMRKLKLDHGNGRIDLSVLEAEVSQLVPGQSWAEAKTDKMRLLVLYIFVTLISFFQTFLFPDPIIFGNICPSVSAGFIPYGVYSTLGRSIPDIRSMLSGGLAQRLGAGVLP